MTTEIEASQFEACQARLKSGKPLTDAQMRFVQSFQSRQTPKAEADIEEDDSACSVSALARQLGVNRQTIYWHKGRANAPSTLSVSEWRGYLLSHGRSETIGRIGSGPIRRNRNHDTVDEIVTDATLAMFEAISNGLPNAVTDALKLEGISVSAEKIDNVVFALWLRVASLQQLWAGKRGIAGALDCDGDEVEYPTEIVKLCARLTVEASSEPQANRN